MKNTILTSVFALIALFSINTVIAQNPHFNKNNPPTVTVTKHCSGSSSYFEVRAHGTVYGLGSLTKAFAHLDYSYTADFNCYNRGASAGPVPGQSGESGATKDQPLTVTSGNAYFDLSFRISGSCKGNALSSDVTDLELYELELVVAGKTASPNLLTFWDPKTIINGSTNCQD